MAEKKFKKNLDLEPGWFWIQLNKKFVWIRIFIIT